jgi:hypothetical protein
VGARGVLPVFVETCSDAPRANATAYHGISPERAACAHTPASTAGDAHNRVDANPPRLRDESAFRLASVG